VNDAALREQLHRAGYIADEALATALWLAGELQRPLLLEGDAGVGKTALALALARATGRRLVRLQCHEGSTFRRRPTSGTTGAACWRSVFPRAATRPAARKARWPRATSSRATTCSGARCCGPSPASSPACC
jgi:hypothetical protein